MKLTISYISIAAGILSGMKINRMEDKRAKTSLLKDYLALRKVAKEAESDKNEIVSKFQDDWAEVLKSVQAFRDKNEPVVGYDDYLEAEKDANKAIQEISSREKDIELAPVELSAFNGVADDLTLEQVAFLQEIGIIEE